MQIADQTACALYDDGDLYCWGFFGYFFSDYNNNSDSIKFDDVDFTLNKFHLSYSKHAPQNLVDLHGMSDHQIPGVESFLLQPGRLCAKLTGGTTHCIGARYSRATQKNAIYGETSVSAALYDLGNTVSDLGVVWLGSMSLDNLFSSTVNDLGFCVGCYKGASSAYGVIGEDQIDLDTDGDGTLDTNHYHLFSQLPYTCRVQANGQVQCKGFAGGEYDHTNDLYIEYTSSRLGSGAEAGWNDTFKTLSTENMVGDSKRTKVVSLGQEHGCLLTQEGLVHCWGENTLGQLGVSRPSSSTAPVPVDFYHSN